MSYAEGHVRHNPDTKEVALRTVFSDDPTNPQLARLAWLVGTTSMGARTVTTEEVETEGWVDLVVPTPVSPIPGEDE